MKRFVFMTSILALLQAEVAFSHPIANANVSHDAAQSFINTALTMDTNGYVHDADGAIAQVTSRGNIRQVDGIALGHIAGNGDIYNANGDRLGHIDEIGYIYDHQNRILALHDISGYLLNVDGTLIRNQPVSRELVVFLYFFQE